MSARVAALAVFAAGVIALGAVRMPGTSTPPTMTASSGQLAQPAQSGTPNTTPASQPPNDETRAKAKAELVASLAKLGIRLEPDLGLCVLRVRVGIRDDLLEYVLVQPRGQSHESLFLTDASPRALNAALLALGVQPGQNMRTVAKDPPPTQEQLRDGVPPYTVEVPSGDGFYLYAAWRSGDETYFHRVEDLVRNLATGKSMERHRWVYLGSKTAPDKKNPGQTLFAAEVEGNLVNLALFDEGFTLVSAALPECIQQTIWLPNAWLLPERGEEVDLIFAREKLAQLPASLQAALPAVPARAQEDARK